MDKKEYFSKSKELGVSLRCPILERCSRRAWTIYISSYHELIEKGKPYIDFLIKQGELCDNFKKNQIKITGEAPSFSKGSDYYSFNDICPEVGLFDKNHSSSINGGVACSSGSWDKFRTGNKVEVSECRHYSECPEYNCYVSNENRMELYNSNNQSIKNQVQEYLINNKLDEALSFLSKKINESDNSDLHNSLIILISRSKRLKKAKLLRIEKIESLNIEENQLVSDILSLTDGFITDEL